MYKGVAWRIHKFYVLTSSHPAYPRISTVSLRLIAMLAQVEAASNILKP